MKGILIVPVVVAVLLSGCCPVNGVGSRSVTLRPQETNNWCWAAVTEMPLEAMGESVQQCALANQRFGRNDCCDIAGCPKSPACNMPGWTMYTELGYDFDSSGTAFSLFLVAATRGGDTLLSPVSATVPADIELAESMTETELVAALSAYAKDFDARYGEEIRNRRLVN